MNDDETTQGTNGIMSDATSAELQRRLDAATQRLREIEDRRATEIEKHELVARVEAAEIEARDAEEIEKAEEKYGIDRVGVVRTRLGCVIVKRPNAVLYKRFQDRESAKTQDLEKLVRPCLVYPDAAAFDRILEEQPATLTRVADCVVELAGFRAKEVSGK